ncbi:hypothetical protein DFQ27_004250 [Actinomortierella ambigua]|uniref:Uncharacterized protein n=1 Tax=Actinomortierella ambigua TaxID=1343610 RepID=A0A9P6Q5R3_9FUNG|nr:hypothetical protein DFQ27_004250 [Actinomortierella ambigua]
MRIKSLVVLCSAAVVMANASPQAVTSGALLRGVDTTNPRASPIDIFRYLENQITALASAAVMSARPVKQLVSNFERFVTGLVNFQGIHLNHTSDESIDLKGPLIQMEKAIRELCNKGDDSAPAYRLAVIARGLRDLVPGFNADGSVRTWLLNVLAMDNCNVMQRRGNVTLILAHIVLDTQADKSYTTYIPESVGQDHSLDL